jgi:asparagine synthase (glutamine-hydrolysing)
MLDRCLYHDLRVYLPQLLHKEDRASMAVSIESRVPLLDYRIVELMATVPPSQKIPDNVPKGLLRNAAAAWVPAEILQRRDKVPFTVPMKDWFGGVLTPLAKEIVNSPACLDRGVFDPDVIRRGLLDESELVSLLNIELWFRIYIDKDPWSLAQTSRASRAVAGEPADDGLAAVAPSPVA